MNKIGLEPLIAPHTREEFLDGGWPFTPVAVHGLDETIDALRELPFLKSLSAMLSAWPHSIQAHLPDVKDESSSVDVNSRDAEKQFTNKMGLLFNNVERISPLLVSWIAALSRDLGLPNSTYGRCLVYATPDGKGTAAHFDQNINFVLQLHGTKTWWLAENSNFENPTERHTIGQPLAPELAPYQHGELIREMPATEKKIILKPGSMLFVPRGFWHRTEASGNALALNFTFSQPTWIDLFTLALRSRLSLSKDWRELADGVNSQDAYRREVASAKLEALLVELTHDLPHWEAEDILNATEGPRH
jgi:50S ribosomal protein L16 3-hydroxylase